MKLRTGLRVVLIAIPVASLCGGCFNSASIESKDCALHVYEGPKPKPGADSQYVEVAGVRIVVGPDRSPVVVFPSGRREPLGAAEGLAQPDDAFIASIAACVWAEPVHRLPKVLSADIHRGHEPETTDALRAGWALLANDHVAVRGQWRNWRFAGWLRLTDEAWVTLFDAVRQARTPPAGSTRPAGVASRPTD